MILMLFVGSATGCKSDAKIAEAKVEKEIEREQKLTQLKTYSDETWTVKQINLQNDSSITNDNTYAVIIENPKGERRYLKAVESNRRDYGKLQSWMLAHDDQLKFAINESVSVFNSEGDLPYLILVERNGKVMTPH